MNITGAMLSLFFGCLLLLIASCAGFAAFGSNSTHSNDWIFATLSGMVSAITFVIALLCFRQAVRDLFSSPTQSKQGPTPAVGFACPRCGGTALVRLERNDISPWREFRCEGCGARLANPAGRFGHAAVALVAAGFVAWMVTMTIAAEGGWRLPFGIGGVAVTVLVYCLRQLVRPAARRVRE
jgi:predicted RNA-binding Zn-ribbon protein involved in translation (DUF1610 family)